jgi:hypothetical protein
MVTNMFLCQAFLPQNLLDSYNQLFNLLKIHIQLYAKI